MWVFSCLIFHKLQLAFFLKWGWFRYRETRLLSYEKTSMSPSPKVAEVNNKAAASPTTAPAIHFILPARAHTPRRAAEVLQSQIPSVTPPALSTLWLWTPETCITQEKLMNMRRFVRHNYPFSCVCIGNGTKLYLLCSGRTFVSDSTLIIFSLHFFPLESTSTLEVFWRIRYS